MPSLHTIWIGPPTASKETETPGHAICGPKKIARALPEDSPKLNYWCLEKHTAEFSKIFEDDSNIDVHSIETYLETHPHPSHLIPYIKFLKRLIIILLYDTERNQTKDKVTVKNAFALFLLMSQGGYVFDTNLEPLEGMRLHFPESDALCLPCFAPKETRLSALTHKNFDWWLMYNNLSSPTSCARVYKIFDRWISGFEEANKIFSSSRYSSSYFSYLSRIGVNSVLLTDAVTDLIDPSALQPIYATKSPYGTHVSIDSMGLKKYYFNSHTYDAYTKSLTPQIFIAIQCGYMMQLQELLQHGTNPNQLGPISRSYPHISPLCFAIILDNIEAIRLLLRYGASYQQKCIFADDITKTVQEFATEINKTALIITTPHHFFASDTEDEAAPMPEADKYDAKR